MPGPDPLAKYGAVPAEGDPLARYGAVTADDEDDIPPIVVTPEGVPAVPAPGPAPRAPSRPEVIHPGETGVTEFGQGASFETLDEARAQAEAIGNWLASRRRDPLNPAFGRVPETAGRGVGAPLKGSSEYLADLMRRRAESRTQNPGTALAANLGGAVVGGAAIPAARAAEVAGFLGRLAAGAKNIAADTAVGAATGAAAADPGARVEGALEAAPLAAGFSTALRAVPGAVREGIALGRRGWQTVLPKDVRGPAELLTSAGAEGREARAAAQRGQLSLDPTTAAITKTLSEGEELTDAVLDYAKVGLKRAPIVRAMATEGVDTGRAVLRTGKTLEELALEIEQMHDNLADFEPAGKQAIRYAKDAFDNADWTEALGRTASEGGDAAADLFMRVDQLKRKLGRAVKRAGHGANSDPLAEERLNATYHTLRDLLEDKATWGEGAATVQREVNAAWTPWLTRRKAFAETLLASTPRKRGANPFDDLSEADPAKVQSLLQNAGREGNKLLEKDLQVGLETTEDLVKALAKHYDAPPEIVEKALAVGTGARDILERFGQTKKDLVAARELRDVAAAAPKLGAAVNVAGAAEDVARQYPKAAAAVGAARRFGAGAGEPARKVVASQTGARAAEGQRESRRLDPLNPAFGRVPETVGRGIDAPLKGSAAGQRQSAADDAVNDPKYGAVLKSKSPDQRAVSYSVLMQTDPEFHARMRARAKARADQEDEQE